MSLNPLVYGSENPPAESIILRAGVLWMEFRTDSGAIRYIELPDGTEAVRAVYASLRGPAWQTESPEVSHLKLEEGEESFSISFDLDYDSPYEAKVTIEGGPDGIVYTYAGIATGLINTSRAGLCVLHPAALADQPVEILHPDGKKESGRFPDLVQESWPFREVVGVSSKFPGYKVEITMEGETFEMEDQRNYGDASFKTYCRPQSLPFPYEIAVGERVTQTVKITAKPWGAKAEVNEPVPDGLAALMFLDEAVPVPLIGLSAGAEPDPNLVRTAPVDFLRIPAATAERLPVPTELLLDLSEDAEARIEQAIARINVLSEPPERVIVTPLSAAKHIPALKEALGEVLVLASSGIMVELNRSGLKPADADGISLGFHPQGHLIDDQTLFENLEAIPDLIATAAERTEGPIILGPIRLDGKPDARTSSLVYAAWTVAALAALSRSDVDAAVFGDLEGHDGLFRDGKPIPAYHVLADLHEFSDGEMIVAIGTARRVAGIGLVLDENFRAIVANLTSTPLRVSMVAAGDAPHYVRVLDGKSVEMAINDPVGFRKGEGEVVLPSESMIEFDLGAYGVACVDAVVDDLNAGDETFSAE